MKRIQSACLMQTIHFQLKDDLGHDAAVRAVKEELASYKAQLLKSRTKFRITDEAVQKDGSILLKITKQYQTYPCNGYLDE